MQVSVGIPDFPYMRWTININLVEPLVMGTHAVSFSFVILIYLDYTQYYMMLMEHCGHIVAKGQATVSCLGQEQIHVYSVT